LARDAERRENTLLLRYEYLTLRQQETIRRIADFPDAHQKKPFTADFGELHGRYPTLFRRGSNQMNVEELGKYERLFYRMHGSTMQRLGYGTPLLFQRITGTAWRAYQTAVLTVGGFW
jgi:hypothetical protein